MSLIDDRIVRAMSRAGTQLMPFADAATDELPWSRLLRLALFQVSVGMSAVLLVGTLNRVMIVELSVPATIVSTMVALPLIFAPLRALIGFRSDTHRSVLGWRRVPYLWLGTIVQFCGLSMMPFALLVLSGDTWAPPWAGQFAAAISFLLVGAGMHTVQTVGFALATDLAPRESQPNVVAVLSVLQLIGMVGSAVLFGLLLADFSQVKLIQVIQGAAGATVALNLIAAWKQEPRDPSRTRGAQTGDPGFVDSLRTLGATGPWRRRLAAVGLGAAGFGMQDVLLEPYGGQILGLTVGQTTGLTALFAGGGIIGFATGARRMRGGQDPYRLAAYGALIGAFALGLIIFSAPLASAPVFAVGVAAVGLGGGIFLHTTLTACMRAAPREQIGLAIGVWGAVQASAGGGAIILGGLLRDVLVAAAESGTLGPGLLGPASGYTIIYGIEVVLLFLTMAVIGPLVRSTGRVDARPQPGAAVAGHVNG